MVELGQRQVHKASTAQVATPLLKFRPRQPLNHKQQIQPHSQNQPLKIILWLQLPNPTLQLPKNLPRTRPRKMQPPKISRTPPLLEKHLKKPPRTPIKPKKAKKNKPTVNLLIKMKLQPVVGRAKRTMKQQEDQRGYSKKVKIAKNNRMRANGILRSRAGIQTAMKTQKRLKMSHKSEKERHRFTNWLPLSSILPNSFTIMVKKYMLYISIIALSISIDI